MGSIARLGVDKTSLLARSRINLLPEQRLDYVLDICRWTIIISRGLRICFFATPPDKWLNGALSSCDDCFPVDFALRLLTTIFAWSGLRGDFWTWCSWILKRLNRLNRLTWMIFGVLIIYNDFIIWTCRCVIIPGVRGSSSIPIASQTWINSMSKLTRKWIIILQCELRSFH